MNRRLITTVSATVAVILLVLTGCSTGSSTVEKRSSVEEPTSQEPSSQEHESAEAALPEGVSLQSEHWEAYGREVGKMPQVVVVDAGVDADALDSHLPQLVRVRVEFGGAERNGMPDRETLERLNQVADFLAAVAQERRWSMPGWVTHDGAREFFVYGAAPAAKVLAEVMAAKYPDLDIGFDTKQEPEWKTYRTLLYPTPADWQVIGNHRVLDQLAAAGDSFTQPRRVTHWAYFPSTEQRAAFVENLGEFEIDETVEREADQGPAYAVRFSHTTSVEPPTINSITIRLMRLAAASGGNYDGWETTVAAASE